MELTTENVWTYLSERGCAPVRVRELSGGVSSRCFWVDSAAGAFVLKQSLAKLKVAQDWRADPARILTEVRALQELAERLPQGSVPRVLWVDEALHAFAMTAVPAGSWKDELLLGHIDPSVGQQAGQLLTRLVAATLGSPRFAERFADRSNFRALRLEPYYRAVAQRHPDVVGAAERAVAMSEAEGLCLVHGDFSPKNLLVGKRGLALIDFEVAHFGDPAFDVAFCLSLLFVGGFYQPTLWKQREELVRAFAGELAGLPASLGPVEARALSHLGLLVLARVDGKSPVEYLREERVRERVRVAAKGLVLTPCDSYEEALERWGLEVVACAQEAAAPRLRR